MLNSSSNIKLSVDFLFLRFLQHFFYIKDYFFLSLWPIYSEVQNLVQNYNQYKSQQFLEK